MLRRALPLIFAALLAVGILTGYTIAFADHADPTGEDTLANDPAAAVNFTWTLMAAFLVFFMQAGFAFLGAGLIRAKNTTNFMTKSFMDFAIASLSFWAFGFAFMFGGAAYVGLEDGNDFIGSSGFFLPLIHRRRACRRPAEETKGCASESGIMVLKQKTGPRKGAPDRCYHVTTPTASKSPSTTTAWWPMPG